MRIRLPLIFAVALIASFFVVPTAAAFRAEPVPRSPLNQRGRFDTDLFTGMANYSHSIPLPKGTADLTPNVSLDYNSGSAHDMSAVAGGGLGGIAVELKAGSSSSNSYTYDANGNMTSDGTNCYQFNEANQLDKVTECSSSDTIAEYVYDYNGNRMVKRNFVNDTLHNTVTSWSDTFETKVLAAGGTETTSYYFANNELIAKKNNDGSKYYYHNDHLGSTSVLTNSSGTLVEATKYDPWGEVTSGGTASKFLYTGQEADAETGLHYYNFRYYDPSIRRFTQADDTIQNVYDPQTLNRYSYVRNNPLRYTDPTGHATALSNAGLWINDYLAPKSSYGYKSIGGSTLMSSLNRTDIPSNQTKQQVSAPINNIAGLSKSSSDVPVAGKSVNDESLLGSNIINNSYRSNSQRFTYKYSKLPEKGYFNIGISGGFIVGATAGVLVNDSGYNWYWGLGYTTPGISPSVTYSPKDPEPGISSNMSFAEFGGTVVFNGPLHTGPVRINELFQGQSVEVGVSLPGYSIWSTETFEHNGWWK